MTLAQQKMVEDNVKLVRGVIKAKYPTYIYDEDIYQIGCIGLIKAAKGYDPDNKSKAVFGTYATYCIINELKYHFIKAYRPKRQAETIPLDVVNYADNTTEENILDNLLIREIENALLRMGERKKKIIWMYFIEDKSQKEIAEHFNINQSNISAELKVILERLKKELNIGGTNETR